MGVVDCSFDRPLDLEETAAMPLAGGIAVSGDQCGMLWGGALAPGAQAEAVYASQKVVESFRKRARDMNCSEITEIEWKRASKEQLLRYLVRGSYWLDLSHIDRCQLPPQHRVLEKWGSTFEHSKSGWI